MPVVVVIVNQSQHPIKNPRASELINFIAQHQELFNYDSGSWAIDFKGDSLNIKPSFNENIKVKAAAS